ncbi:hypothetical protein F4808DRAFT_458586 [Astrocystis sublimbata]|nr:hypothetical protein F4808DRAFT_458586 [Astrocystis sublimbata]
MAKENDNPSYGRRLMPTVLDQLAEATPGRLYAAIPMTADVTKGFRNISVADMAQCVNHMARWIEDHYGKSQSFETISYIGTPDLRGAAIFLAAVKCGYKLLLPSPRNPPATNASLIEQTECSKLLYASEVSPLVNQLQETIPTLNVSAVPSFDEMVTSKAEYYPYHKSFEQCCNEPVVVLHSSGSTGLPKPITMTHGSFAALDNEHNLPEVPGRRKRDWSMWTFEGEARVYTVFPFFHLAGFLSLTLQTIFMNASPVLGPPHLIPDASLLKLVIQNQRLRCMFLPPAVIEQLLHEPNGIDFFKGLDFLVYSGAPFSPAIGDKLSKVVEIISPFGSTEVYPQPELAPSREDWAYHEFNPYVKHKMELYDAAEGTFELVILVDESSKATAATYHNLPGISEYHTKDLFVQHPHKPQLYKYYGRRDDIIVLANGEKFNPIPLEVNVQNHPSLKGAFVIGNSRRQAALLIESKTALDLPKRQSLIEDLWPLVSESNGLIAGPGRIQKGRILCSLPAKPFTRTGKGTIVRKLTEEAYKEEIEQLYLDASSQTNTSFELQPTTSYTLSSVTDFVRNIAVAALPAVATMKDDEDFVMHGLDSEQTVEIVSTLKRNLRGQTERSVDWISPRTVFRNSTIGGLSKVVQSFLNDGVIPEEDLKLSRARAVDEAVSLYSEGLLAKTSRSKDLPKAVSTVAIVGSTGYLGLYLVNSLIKDPNISRVFCLNRSEDAQSRQENALLKLDSSTAAHLKKLVFMTIDLEKPSLGLSAKNLKRVTEEVDTIVLNAWKSNFVLPLRHFSPFLNGTRELIRLAASSSRQMRIVFVSSLASVGNLARSSKVSEALVQDPLAAMNNGYGQSKLAAERILAAGYEQSGVPVSIVRVTQIGGPAQAYSGKWADQGWISAIVKTAKSVKLVPITGPSIDWVPVDTIAEMLHRYATNQDHSGLHFYNLRHPHPQSWDAFAKAMQDRLQVSDTTDFPSWIQNLRDTRNAGGTDNETKLPALMLLDYYEEEYNATENPAYDVTRALEESQVEIPPLDIEMLRVWLDGWEL